MTRTIKKKVTLPFAVEHVWNALSNSSQLQDWFIGGEFDASEGAHFNLNKSSAGNFKGSYTGEIISSQPPINLAYSWSDPKLQHTTYVWWKLEDVRGNAVLELEHSGFKGVSDYIQSFRYSNAWRSSIKKLEKYLKETEAVTG